MGRRRWSHAARSAARLAPAIALAVFVPVAGVLLAEEATAVKGAGRPASGPPIARHSVPTAVGNRLAEATDAAAEGYRILRREPLLPPDFDADVFRELWTVWPEPHRSRAARAEPLQRRRLIFEYYGLMEPPDETGRRPETPADVAPALGYVDDGHGGWVMNCLACHGGQVDGRVIPGLPNSNLALQTLVEDVRRIKVRQLKGFAHLDLASLKLPLAQTAGTTNAVVFGIVLGSLRDRDMNVDLSRRPPPLMHHPVDPPPLWNVRKKRMLYCDAFAPKNPRVLMQFMLIPRNDAAVVRRWEPKFAKILAWIESLRPPPYPGPIDRKLASAGRRVFERHCAECHGTYGPDGHYPQRVVPIDEVGTDPLRLRALNREHRRWLAESWMSGYGRDPVVLDPVGYVAPPLDGIWATAPYFHNGSVPTLWHVLHPRQRPKVWKRHPTRYDHRRMGLAIEEFDSVPASVRTPAQRRRYYDTTRPGHSAAGHDFAEPLSESERRALLEYLKTL
ncbi:MAG: cytochrome c [Planctomycetota bacterium]|nr:MAG: cytochrome c [Planctomycetota bacterium]